MPTTPPTDEMLALQLQRGSAADLRLLVERHHGPLIGYLYRLSGGDRALAEDLVQEAFLRALNAIQSYVYPRPFKPWLYAIATNLARDHYKRAETQRTVLLSDDLDMDAIRCDPPDVLAGEEAAQVAAALGRLPTHQRETVILRYYQELSLAEIAEALAIPVGTVKSRLSLGLKQLREELQREFT